MQHSTSAVIPGAMRVEERLLRYFQWRVLGLVDTGRGSSLGDRSSATNKTPDAPGWLMEFIDVGVALDKLPPREHDAVSRRWRLAVDAVRAVEIWHRNQRDGMLEADAKMRLNRVRREEERRSYSNGMMRLKHLLGRG